MLSLRNRVLVIAALVLGTLLVTDSSAEVLHLEGGRRVVGRIVSRDDATITIRAYGGDVRVPRSDIVRIEGADEPAPDIGALVRSHRRGLRRGDVTGALRLADLASEHGLEDEEGELLRLAAAWKPESREIRSRLGAWERVSLRLPASARVLARVRREFGAPCEVHRTPRYVIAHDVAPDNAARAGDSLERTWTRLHELGDALSFELRAPETALPVHLRTGHSHWTQFMEVVGELLDVDEGLRVGTVPVNAPDGSRHVEGCELVVAIREAEEILTTRRTALARAIEDLEAVRETVRDTRAAGATLWVSRTRRAADVTRRLLDDERGARESLKVVLDRTQKLLVELPRVHPVPAGPRSPLAAGSAWSVVRHESVSGERVVSRLERLESLVRTRFTKGAALGPDELDELDLRLTKIVDLAIPVRLSLRDRAKAAAGLRVAVAESLAAGDRLALTRGAARQLALETRLLAATAPTWLTEGVSALIETGDGETDALTRDAGDASRALGRAWEGRPRDALANLMRGGAFQGNFTRARDDAAALLRLLVARHPAATGTYLADVRDGRVAGDDAAAFELRFGPVADLLPAPPVEE